MAAKEEQIEVAFVGESDDLKLIAGDLDELDDSRIVEFELQRLKKELEKCQKQEFDFGRCEIEQCTKTITECKGAILVLSQELLYGKNDQISLYKIIFTLANLKKKERCGILVDMPRADLAVGLQNMRFVCLKKDEDQLIRQQKLASLERYLRESRDEIPKIGNIAQGQAFSNFFGFFNIVLPQLDVMWNDFEKKYMEDLKPPGVKCTIFRKMVEVMWPQGKNPDHLADELQGLGRIENIDKIISDKKLRKEVTESFTRVKSRCGAPERQYPAKLFRVYNQDKSKAFYFVGQIAPSGNVFHKVLESAEGDNSKKHRRWYAETSQKIADHRLNTDCNGKLFVLQVEDVNKADDQIFNALEKAESEKAESEKAESGGNTEPASPGGGDVEVKKCLIVNADYTHNESIDRIKKYLKKRGIDVAEIDIGQKSNVRDDSETDSCDEGAEDPLNEDIYDDVAGSRPVNVEDLLNTIASLRSECATLKEDNNLLKAQLASAIIERDELKVATTVSAVPAPPSSSCSLPFSVQSVVDSKIKDLFEYYTGLTYKAFITLFEFLIPDSQSRPKYTENRNACTALCVKDQLFLVLCRLRNGLDVKDLAFRFDIDCPSVSILFSSWIRHMYLKLGFLSLWPHRDVIIENMTEKFKAEFPNTLAIIDCTELKTQTPSSLTAQSQCYSDYKSHTTLKALVVTDPRGSIMFTSALFSGSISDNEICHQGGLYDLLKDLMTEGYIQEDDAVMADKGFRIEKDLEKLGLKLNIPPFASSAHQMSPADVEMTKKIARHRIHVERAINRIKNFKLVSRIIPITLFANINEIWSVCCMLTLFLDTLVRE